MNINERTAPLKLVGTAPSSNEGGGNNHKP
jgi:hypothetical protein